MRPFIAIIAFGVFIAYADVASAEPSATLAEFQNLNNELRALMAEEKNELANQVSLRQQNERLSGARASLEADIRNFRAEYMILERDANNLQAEIARQREEAGSHEDKVRSHNSKCRGSSSDQSFVNWCNAAAAQLNARTDQIIAWGRQLNNRGDRLSNRQETLKSKRENLQKRAADFERVALSLEKRQKENYNRLNELAARKQALRQRLLTLMESARKKMSQECANLVAGLKEGGASWQLNDPYNQVIRCMQRIYEGVPC